jgi:tripartite-type tricarboxylate transporter receptor subunit TctC
MDVYRQDTLAVDLDRQARRLRLSVGRIKHAATAKDDSARSCTFQEIPAGSHWLPPCGRSADAPAHSSFYRQPHCQVERGRAIILGKRQPTSGRPITYREKLRMRLLYSLIPALALILAPQAGAQTAYPDRPIKMIVPLAAASAVDVAARIVTQKMADNMGQQFVILNQPGASGLIGAEAVARAEPDGYTIGGFNDSIMTMVPNLQSKLRWDILKDFEPVSLVATVEWGLVANNNTSFKSAADLIAAAKAAPGKIDYGSGGPGSPQHLAMAMFASAAGISLTHVPYKGATQAATDVAAGQIPVGFQGLGTVAALVRGGQLKLIGVTTEKRLPQFPGVPTVSESGLPGFLFNSWFAMLAPAGTPKEIIARLNAEVLKAVGDPEVRRKLEELGFAVRGSSAEELRVMTRDQLAKYARVIKEMGIANE